ncbi:TIGR03435 family protein [Terriglobus roseus]|nr:TIGR03435 family protein [Terriglobus roseus]
MALAVLNYSFCEAQHPSPDSRAVGHSFATVSIKPSSGDGNLDFGPIGTGYRARNSPLLWVIMQAYYPQTMAYWRKERLLNAPDWVQSVKFDIDAKLEDKDLEGFAKLTSDEKARALAPYLQAMLRDRCMLQIAEGQSPGKYYALTVGKRGLTIDDKTPPIAGGIPLPDGGSYKPIYSEAVKQHVLTFSDVSMSDFATVLTGLIGEDGLPIHDETGLVGRFNFTLFPTDAQSIDRAAENEPTGTAPSTRWNIGALGLSLKQAKGNLPSLTVVHIERPSAN